MDFYFCLDLVILSFSWNKHNNRFIRYIRLGVILMVIYIKTPNDTILNYFSLLREVANPVEGKYIGCGLLEEYKVKSK